MAKARALDAGIDLTARTRTAATATAQRGATKETLVPMQFKMSADFAVAFKVFAASRRMKMNELLKTCFEEKVEREK